MTMKKILLNCRYDPLCEKLNERLERKKLMVEKLGSSVLEERRIMGDTKVSTDHLTVCMLSTLVY